MALEYSFLMHGLLSVAAIHLSHLKPERQEYYALQAAYHQDSALPVYRRVVTQVDRQNCHAVFAFSSAILQYTLASTQFSHFFLTAKPEEVDGVPKWMRLLRGKRAIFMSIWGWIEDQNSQMGQFVSQEMLPADPTVNPDDLELVALISLFSSSANDSPERERELQIYRAALHELRTVYSMPYAPNSTINVTMAAFLWAIRISDEFVDLLGLWKPEALVLLAYHCVLLDKSKSRWFIANHARGLLSVIHRNLDDGWKTWLEWPFAEVGLMAEPDLFGQLTL
ncbi:hypothetical protein MMC13_004861 [Lambiella insularis]|nr:hypothetical protein [Lambiella insularis]